MPGFWGSASLCLLSTIPLASLFVIPQIMDKLPEIMPRQAATPGNNSNGTPARASYAIVSLFCMFIMAALFGSRLHTMLSRKYWKDLPFIRLLPYSLYLFGMLFNTAAALSINGTFNLGRAKDCKGMMYNCLVFFVLTKTSVQLFLIERAHAVRANVRDRLHDWVWLTFVFILVVGFGTIAILGFMAPVGVVDPDDGQCRIGLPRTSLLVLMTYDILISVALTVVFVILLQQRLLVSLLRIRKSSSQVKLLPDSTPSQGLTLPVLRVQKSDDTGLSDGERSTTSGRSAPSMTSLRTKSAPVDMVANEAQTKRLRLLIAKSITGAIVMLVATTLNLGLLR
ncbi:hypothetical protein LTR17_022254 [Elasticomyces elasticus]|nr:hypothetical protein LTR17_022254 [Elasticomyces elasticus]